MPDEVNQRLLPLVGLFELPRQLLDMLGALALLALQIDNNLVLGLGAQAKGSLPGRLHADDFKAAKTGCNCAATT